VKRRALAVLVVLLAALLVGACREPAQRGVVLWHSYTGQEKAALEQLAARWNARHPDEPLTLVAVPEDSFADKLTSAIPHGNGPDLFIFAHDRIAGWADAGTIEPLEYWVDDACADRFRDDALRALAYHDSLWGLPLAVKSLALYYNTDLVARPPATTDELFALAPAMRQKDGFALAYANTDLYSHAPWLHAFGGQVMTAGGELAIATPEATAALQFARRLVAEGVSPDDADATHVAGLFNSGKAATVMSGPWFRDDISGVHWQVATLPIVSTTGKPAAPFLTVEAVLMSAHARDKDTAFAVMDELTGDASAVLRARIARQVVVNRRAYDDPAIAGDAFLRTFRDQLDHTVMTPDSPAMRSIWTPYNTALVEVLAGRADAGDALLHVEREVSSYLEHK
jgi:maltose-binding protein MalE